MDKFVIRRKKDLDTSGEWLSTKKPPKQTKSAKQTKCHIPKSVIRRQSKGDSLPQSSSESIGFDIQKPSIQETSDVWENMIKELCSPTFREDYKRSFFEAASKNKETSEAKENCGSNHEVDNMLSKGQFNVPICSPLSTSPLENQQIIGQEKPSYKLSPLSSTPEKYDVPKCEFPSPAIKNESPLQIKNDSPTSKKEYLDSSGEWLTTKNPPTQVKKPTVSKPTTWCQTKAEKLQPQSSTTIVRSSVRTSGLQNESKNNSDPWDKLVRDLCSPTFQEEYKRTALNVFDRSKEIANLKEKSVPIRNAEVRTNLMHGYECRCCAPYYDALNLTPGERQQRINQVSRHRGFQPMPSTPERYWDIEFPTTQEQRNLGLIIETDSPLFKTKPKRSLSRNNRRRTKRKSSVLRKSLTPKNK